MEKEWKVLAGLVFYAGPNKKEGDLARRALIATNEPFQEVKELVDSDFPKDKMFLLDSNRTYYGLNGVMKAISEDIPYRTYF